MKTDRLVSIIMMLLAKKRTGARELADLFEVSVRTIYRDIESINMAGIPIRSIPGAGGGFEIMPEYKIDKRIFSAAELSAILTGLSSLSNVVRDGELVNALAKVKSFIPAERARDIEIRSNQICIDLSPWMGNQNIPLYLKTVKAALQDRRLLSFRYTAHHGVQTVRTVEPYRLVMKGGHWYLYGYCHTRDSCRLFRLSRISDLEMKQETFLPRDNPGPVLDFQEILTPVQVEVKLRIHKPILDRVLEYCTYDRFAPDGDEHYLVHFPFVENEYYYDILLGFGDKCECIEPLHIRRELKRRICNIAAIYYQNT